MSDSIIERLVYLFSNKLYTIRRVAKTSQPGHAMQIKDMLKRLTKSSHKPSTRAHRRLGSLGVRARNGLLLLKSASNEANAVLVAARVRVAGEPDRVATSSAGAGLEADVS